MVQLRRRLQRSNITTGTSVSSYNLSDCYNVTTRMTVTTLQLKRPFQVTTETMVSKASPETAKLDLKRRLQRYSITTEMTVSTYNMNDEHKVTTETTVTRLPLNDRFKIQLKRPLQRCYWNDDCTFTIVWNDGYNVTSYDWNDSFKFQLKRRLHR